jgi:hypothetical protein
MRKMSQSFPQQTFKKGGGGGLNVLDLSGNLANTNYYNWVVRQLGTN